MPEIVPLGPGHDRVAFDCGSAELNALFKATARQHAARGISRTWVLADPNAPGIVIDFFTLALCELQSQHLPTKYTRKYPKHPLAVVRLARLAVSKKHQRQGYGEMLLMEAIHRTVLISEQGGGIGLFVDAKDSSRDLFMSTTGFLRYPEIPCVYSCRSKPFAPSPPIPTTNSLRVVEPALPKGLSFGLVMLDFTCHWCSFPSLTCAIRNIPHPGNAADIVFPLLGHSPEPK